jgi:hypothetical protein
MDPEPSPVSSDPASCHLSGHAPPRRASLSAWSDKPAGRPGSTLARARESPSVRLVADPNRGPIVLAGQATDPGDYLADCGISIRYLQVPDN